MLFIGLFLFKSYRIFSIIRPTQLQNFPNLSQSHSSTQTHVIFTYYQVIINVRTQNEPHGIFQREKV